MLGIGPHSSVFYSTPNLSGRRLDVYEFGAPQQILTDFASWLRYCSDVARQRPTKLYMIFGRLLGWYTILGAEGAAYIRLGDHHVGHRPTF